MIRFLIQVGQVEFKVVSRKENDYKCAYTIRRNYYVILVGPAHRFPPKNAETMKRWQINYIIRPSHPNEWLMFEHPPYKNPEAPMCNSCFMSSQKKSGFWSKTFKYLVLIKKSRHCKSLRKILS